MLCSCNFISLFYYFSCKFSSSRVYMYKIQAAVFILHTFLNKTTINYFANTTPVISPAESITILIRNHHQSLLHIGVITSPLLPARIVHEWNPLFTAQSSKRKIKSPPGRAPRTTTAHQVITAKGDNGSKRDIFTLSITRRKQG